MRFGLLVVLGAASSTLGCAEHLHLLDRGPTAGVSPCSFWPPPPSSTTWLAARPQSLPPESLSAVARELELSLREVGYSEQRWYPIGRGQSHGFAVTTRLEQLEADLHHPPHERWSSLYVDAADLRWLMQARTPTLPHPGRYRVVLLAYTDLPIERSSNAPTWNEETIMDWPGGTHASSAREAGAPAFASTGYRLGIYEYEYEYLGEDVDHRGKWVPHDAKAESERAPPLASRLRAHGFTPRLVGQF